MNLSAFTQNFILHFGEMGNRWGINRTVGQIYALLFISNQALNAEQIAQTLNFSRSNTSMGLKELMAWNLVKLQHVSGDRREYFSAPEDIWVIFRTLAQERKKREIDPTLTMLRASLMLELSDEVDVYAQVRMRKMHELIELTTNWFDEMQELDEQTLRQLMKMGKTAHRFLKLKDAFSFKSKSTPTSTLTSTSEDDVKTSEQ